jgi:hypothetical protein
MIKWLLPMSTPSSGSVAFLPTYNENKLLAADPAGEQEYEKREWRGSEAHMLSVARDAPLCLNYRPSGPTRTPRDEGQWRGPLSVMR